MDIYISDSETRVDSSAALRPPKHPKPINSKTNSDPNREKINNNKIHPLPRTESQSNRLNSPTWVLG